MSRDALVVGINQYKHLGNLNAPAVDAQAIATILSQYGDFHVKWLPDVEIDNLRQVGRKTPVTYNELTKAIRELFLPQGPDIPTTALFFFSGHGLREEKGVSEGYLATSDATPEMGFCGVSLRWLRDVLQKSLITQQIVWLDCCYAAEFLNFEESLEDSNPGDRGGRDRHFITACRVYEEAYEKTAGHGVLTEALLEGLDPHKSPGRTITNLMLTEGIRQRLRTASQHPQCTNFGSKIILTSLKYEPDIPQISLPGICPYKGLEYFDFNEEDPQYFYGRTQLIDKLLNNVRTSNFVAVLGASGSGKSSLVRAGLLYQLKLGNRLGGSQDWQLYLLRPGEHPLHSLSKVFVDSNLAPIDYASQLQKAEELMQLGQTGLRQLISAFGTKRVILVVDQFEECFTRCQDRGERQAFFETVLGAIKQLNNKLCLVLTMRADFLNKCFEYSGLATSIQDNLVFVEPMKSEQLREAIVEPAKQVGLEVEEELVKQILIDLGNSPGSLPLLQYTLRELWKRREINWLTLASYNHLGGVRGTLENRAEKIYQALLPEQKETAKYIFLELIQLGERTEDTRRQVIKRELITPKYSEELLDRVIQKLAEERLIVTSEMREKSGAKSVEVIDIAHEALIRYWHRLRDWVEENRLALKQKRDIEKASEQWLEKNKSEDYLFKGKQLIEVESFLKKNNEIIPLSTLAQEFIKISQIKQKNRWRLQLGFGVSFAATVIGSITVFILQQQEAKRKIEQIFLAENPQEFLTALPSVLESAKKLNNSNSKDELDRAASYYRQILATTNKFLETPNIFSESQSELEKQRDDTEENLTQVLEKNPAKIPKLVEQLKNNEFGYYITGKKITDYEKQFTGGAIQTTYQLLMRDFGAGADINNNGKLDSNLEANQLPCKLLEKIEKLWQDKNSSCYWDKDPDNHFISDPRCIDYSDKTAGITLNSSVFDYPDGTKSAIIRINVCKKKLMNTPK
jgi:KaiC/GvpD/RAD55 family RecA-like ATPase